MAGIKKLLNTVMVPVVVVRRDLSVMQANTAARQSFPRIKPNRPLYRLGFSKKILNRLIGTAEAQGQAEKVLETDELFVRDFLISAKLAAWLGEEDEPAFVLTFEDRSALRDAKSMRSDFVANVSHEIRSPLTAISGFVETLQGDAADDPEAREMFLGLMAREAERMTLLVSDLLSLSQVEVKERRLPRKKVAIGQVLDQAHEAVSDLAKKRGKRLERRVDDLPEIFGKRDDLARVFINLLENAINYSRDDARIELVAERAGEENPLNKPALRIAVSDEGEGIPAREIPRLTERFYRVDKSRSRNMGGTGLGLAIVKHILMRHRGEMVIESTQGQGSVFTVYLPLPIAAKPDIVT